MIGISDHQPGLSSHTTRTTCGCLMKDEQALHNAVIGVRFSQCKYLRLLLSDKKQTRALVTIGEFE